MLKVDVEITPYCWIWRGPKASNGYGKACILKETIGAHRVFYEHYKGSIPDGFYVVSTCKNKLCVNPQHLDALARQDAILLGFSPCAINAKKTLCIRGHALKGANLYVTPDGRRQCKACRARATRLNHKRKYFA